VRTTSRHLKDHPRLPFPAPPTIKLPSPDPRPNDPDPTTPTNLVPDETTEHAHRSRIEPPAEVSASLGSTFRHTGWTRIRRRVYAAMNQLGLSATRLDRFAHCGDQAWLEARNACPWRIDPDPPPHHPRPKNRPTLFTDKTRLRCNTCKDRFCVPCATVRARLVSNALIRLLEGRPARFITLTMVHTAAPLAEQLDKLYACYKRLRRTRLWVKHVDAAAATVEVTYNKTTNTWHPHLHVLAKGSYVPHQDLKAEWRRITRDSYIVSISLVQDERRAVNYLAKYVTKPMVHDYSTHQSALCEAIQALKGRRLVLLTGEWHALQVEKPAPDGVWEYVGTLETVLNRALAGDSEALGILDRLGKPGSWRTRITGQPP